MELELFCEEHGIEAEFINAGKAATAADAAKSLGTTPEHIVKSLVFFLDENPVLVIVRGTDRVDTGKLGEAMHAKEVRMADRDEVEAVSGFRAGAVPPVGTDLEKVIDERVMDLEKVYGGGGSTSRIIGIDPRFIVGERDFVEDVVV